MPRTTFSSLPPHAKLWIFAAARTLTGAERDRILEETDAFLDQWAAHGVPLTSARDLQHDRFLFVAVDERAAGASGCSIDALVRRFKTLETELGVPLTDNRPVHYRDGNDIRRVARDAFADLARSGAVDATTPVFDQTLVTAGDIGRFETTAGASWFAKAFRLPASTTR